MAIGRPVEGRGSSPFNIGVMWLSRAPEVHQIAVIHRVAIRSVFPGHVRFFRVKNSVRANFLILAKCPGFGQIIVYRYSLKFNTVMFQFFACPTSESRVFFLKIRGARSPKNQDRLKRLLPDGSTWGLVVSKALVPQS